mgnify:CR=1 FL=1
MHKIGRERERENARKKTIEVETKRLNWKLRAGRRMKNKEPESYEKFKRNRKKITEFEGCIKEKEVEVR